jgi:protein-glutamine gamma-glutamyltransferase
MASASTARITAPPLPAVQRYFEVSLFLLVSTGIISVISTGKLDPVTTALTPVALIYKGVRIWKLRGPELSARLATGLVLGYFLFFPIDLWVISRNLAEGAPNPTLYAALLAAIHLMLFATLVRLFSARTNRDFAFLAMLAVTCMLASAILTVETSFLVALAIFLVLAVSTFVALEIRRGADNAVSPPLEPGSPLAGKLNRALGITSGLVAIGTLAIGSIFFFAIPRFTSGYLSALSLQPSLMTGFSDNVTLGQIGQIKQSSQVVMRIHVEGDPEANFNIHWRGIVLTNFDGKRWFTPPQHDQIVIPADSNGVYEMNPPLLPAGDSFRMQYTVLMEPIASDAIFVAPRIESLQGRFGNEAAAVGSDQSKSFLLLDDTGSLSNPFHNETKTRYQGVSNVPSVPAAQLRIASTLYPQNVVNTYLQLPQLDPRIKKLAQEITANSPTEYDKANAIESYLKAHMQYSLNLNGRQTDDPLAYFLFTKKSGHCEFFAAAMTVMLRDVGIPARYVGGFLPGEYNDLGGDWIVRASDAHTWVEVFFPGYGWITFDPTPSGEGHRAGLFGAIGKYWDWFQFAWGEWIINYDFSHQMTLAQNAQKSGRNWGESARKYYEDKQRSAIKFILQLDKRAENSRYFLPGLLVILLMILLYLRGRALFNFMMARWSLRARRGGNITASLATLEYREMLRMLEKRGWKKSPSQTAQEFAAAIPSSDVTAAPVAQLTQLYESARFGNVAAPAQQMSSLLKIIRESLRTAVPARS